MNPFQNIYPSTVLLSYTKDPKTGQLRILEENHYYPFGLKHEVYTPPTSKGLIADRDVPGQTQVSIIRETEYMYKYNGKEWQDELNLNWYDFHARSYDPSIGRWFNIDPAAEMSRKVSPYAYALNNPVYFIDPDGMMATPPLDYYNDSGNKIGTDGVDDGRKAVVTKSGEVRQIKRTDGKGGTTQLSSVSSAKVLPSDTALQTSLDVLNDTKSVTASDPTGGLHGESALVFNDGTIARGASGPKGTVSADGNFFTTNENFPDLPSGQTAEDIEVTIHGHATGAFEQDGKIFGGDATSPSAVDRVNSTFTGNTSIITGPLGQPTGAKVLNTFTGEMETKISQKSNGIVIYKGGVEQVRLTEKAVQNIIKN